ncbi:MAG: DUF2076 domain-containing protein, partial [Hyphomicrobiaceae bacterium]
MSPEERDMIEGVFERMRSVGPIEKDPQAEAHINASVRQIRDSAYMLVQTVVVQDQALQQSEARMQELEEMVNQLQAQLEQAQSQAKPSSGGSFLGGIFGGSKPAPAAPQGSSPWGGSVPPVGRQSAGYSGPAAQRSGAPWGGPAPQQGGFNQGGYAQQPMQAQAPQSSGGGFMRSAMTTAAGVAGGVLVAGAIGNMMRGHGNESGAHSTSGDGMSPQPNYQDASSNDQGGTYSAQPQYQDASSNDQGNYDNDAAE